MDQDGDQNKDLEKYVMVITNNLYDRNNEIIKYYQSHTTYGYEKGTHYSCFRIKD